MSAKSTIQPFERGDVFVGATDLNNPDDDHAGDGRILQYDNNLNPKGVLWTEGTTHLVGGLKFGPDKTLWAFDSQAFKVLRFDTRGRQLPEIPFAERSFSNINFAPDGTIYLGEHLVGDTVRLPPDRPLGTVLPRMPGSGRFGDGHVFRFTPEGELLREYATETHGGMPGFLGVTTALLTPDGQTLVYISELGNRIFRYDLQNDRQLDDLLTFEPDSGNMVISIAPLDDDSILYICANFRQGWSLNTLSLDGQSTRLFDLEGHGWGNLCPSIDGQTVLLGNFFTGGIAKMRLDNGEIVARADTGTQRALAGIAQFPG